MNSEERARVAPAADLPVDPARRAGRGRLATVRRDFFLDPVERLTEQERALMGAMLEDLVATIADAILAALPDAELDRHGQEALVARLCRSRLLDRAETIALLLRRSDEQRMAAALQLQPSARRPAMVQQCISGDDPDLAAGAMALVIARRRRRDPFGQPRLLFDDLPAEEAVALTYRVAAGLTGLAPEPALLAAAEAMFVRHDEGQRMEALLAGIVRLIERAQGLDDTIAGQALDEGELGLLSAMIARRGAVPEAIAWDHLVAGSDGRLMLLARIAGLSRPLAARLLAELGPLTGIADPGGELARFDDITEAAVEQARAAWRLPQAFAQAKDRLDG